MDFGAAMFFTDYSMTPVELGQALEARGFESVWAPEHSHIPSTRKTPPASARGMLPPRPSPCVSLGLTAAAAGSAQECKPLAS
jgi:alkanesulfonate monooxygenase SsuD/methylene tetrahydromethanopterin reductase-like flavin-dependent oxidoreductase (luciferase family)